MFGWFLDASKAFDSVEHHALFQKLLRRNLPPVVVQLLLFWYQKQSLQVRWPSTLSEPFSVSNGVRQGGVLSPILGVISSPSPIHLYLMLIGLNLFVWQCCSIHS